MPKSNISRPSKKQKELLDYIDGFITGHGYGPSYREIMRALNYKSVSTVAIHIDNLIAKGYVQKRDKSARSLEIVVREATAPKAKSISQVQEKWLVSQLNARFDDFENAPSERNYDELCILVGALSVLGLHEAAVAAKSRLLSISKSA